MSDSVQPLSEYLAQPGGGGAVLPSKIQQALHDALVNALDVKSAKEVQGFGPEVFVGLYEATVDEEDYLPAYAKIIERWAGDAPPQKRPVSNPTDAKGSEGKSKGAVDNDDDLASLALAYARKHCSPSYGWRFFNLFDGNRFGDATKAAMKAACDGEGEADIIVQ